MVKIKATFRGEKNKKWFGLFRDKSKLFLKDKNSRNNSPFSLKLQAMNLK